MRNFTDLITAYAWTKDAADKRALGDQIWRWYGVNRAVLVVDLCGFSRRSKDAVGILEFLAVIRRMQAAALPVIWDNDGEVVKMEADNCFAVFERAESAALAAQALIRASQQIRKLDGLELEMCCGIEWGEILYLKEEDFFGDAVNTAARLGEDLADADQILIGPAIRTLLTSKGWSITDYDHARAPVGVGMIDPARDDD